MPTLLELANDVFADTGYPDQLAIIGNNAVNVRRMLSVMNTEGRAMAKKAWPVLERRYTFDTDQSVDTYALPSDFEHFVNETMWNDTTDRRVFGPTRTEHWQEIESGIVTTVVDDRFKVFAAGTNERLYLRPVPASAETLTFFYISNGWIADSGGSRKSKFTKDNDSLLLPEEVYKMGVKWRFLRSMRRAFDDERNEYLMRLGEEFADRGGAKTVTMKDVKFKPQANIPDGGFG